MVMPSGFKYKSVYEKGMPRHYGWDSFRIKHPPMPASRWAKIYAPFDALKGFDEAIEAQEEVLVRKPDLGDFEKDELDHKLGVLGNLTRNGKEARKNQVTVTVRYFESVIDGAGCADGFTSAMDGAGSFISTYDSPESTHEPMGKIKELTGIVWKVDATLTHTIRIDDEVIDLADLLSIESPVFDAFEDLP